MAEATQRQRFELSGEQALRAALARLEREAPGARIVELRSSVPLSEDLAALAPSRRSRAPLWGIAGGAGGGALGFLLAYYTAKAFPVVTGHMPIVAGPPSGIVVYEGIALGAVLATTFCVLLEGGMLRRRRGEAASTSRLAAGTVEVTVEADGPSGADVLRRVFESR
jgi:hypothetical protein